MPALFRRLLLLIALSGATAALADGFSNSATAAAGADATKQAGCSGAGCTKCPAGEGDPINTRDGSFYLAFPDLSLGAMMPINIIRRYDSRSEYDSSLGYGWAFDHERRLFEYPDGSVIIRSGCGRRDRFVFTANAFVTPEGGPEGTLEKNSNGTYTFSYASGDADTFDANGWLTQRMDARGNRHEFLYDSRGKLPLIGSSPNAVDPTKPMVVAYMPRLTTIRERGADNVLTGYSVSFTYSADSGRVTRVTGSDGRFIDYTHDGSGANTKGNLIGVAGLTDLAQTFTYADPRDLHNITTFTDGTGAQAVVNTYDTQDRVTQQVDGGSTYVFAYPSTNNTTVTETVRNASGGVIQTRVRKYEYNALGYLIKHTDALGHELRYQYGSNNEISRVEWWTNSSGTLTLLKAVDTTYTARAQKLTEAVTLDSGEKITTTWAYDGAWIKSVETVSTASTQRFRTEYTFLRNSANQPRAIASVRARKDDGTFAVSTYIYCTAAEAAAVGTTCPDIALVKSIDGPRTDVADTASFTYYGSTDITGCATATGNCWRRGDLKTTTNALGQTVTFLRYDTTGRPVQVRDANNVIAEMVYHPRGWLQQSIVRGADNAVTTDDAITQYEVDARGNLTKLTTPDGIALTMVYDARDRLTTLRDASGNEVRYTLDSAGNRLSEQAFDAGNVQRRVQSATFDAVNRLTQLTGSTTAQKTVMTYDAAGRVTKMVDPNLVEVVQTYDDLDRLIQSVADAKTGGLQTLTRYTYDAVGNLRSVVDPKGLTTRYTYDAFGRLTTLESPDTGTSTYTYDDAGNRLTKTDARNKTSTYTYDALNRLLTVTQPTAAENVSFTYDTPSLVCAAGETFTVGRLTRMVDETGSTDYCFDRFGNLVRKVQTTAGRAYTVRYAYTLGNELRSITYPDGMVVDYGRDAQSRIREVGIKIGASARQVLLNNATYLPAGPSTGWTYGNGKTLLRSFDKDYRALTIKGNATGSLDLGFRYDNAGYLTQVTNAALATTPQFKLTYDALGRLTQRSTSANAVLEAYTVDGTGNRTTQTTGTNPATAYTYAANSHRLTQIGSVGRTYDAAGNTTSVGGTQREYAYNDAGRLKEAKQNGSISGSYRYNAKGEQVQRTAGSITTVFVYDEAGSLLGQYDNATGTSIQSYAWMGGIPVGAITANTLHYVEADHLGTPRAVINATSQKAIWRWDLNSEAFGNTAPNTDPDADGTQYVFDLRFPGQRHDQASGLSYNYFRDYEAATGRYSQSDPIGLAGGISTYGYVGGNPLSHTDRTGLVLDTIADVGFIGYDLYVIYRDNIAGNCDNLGENLTSLGLDVLGAAVPFATGLGAAYRMRHLANFAEEAAQHGDEVMNAAQATLCAFNSFDEATLVATDKGPVRIGDLTVGTKVLARNEETGEESYQTVTSKFAEWHETMRSVEVDTGTTTEALLTTDEHPFYVEGKGFIDAEDLSEGDVLLLAGGAPATVTENRVVEKAQLAHNFTVANDHTYFVGEAKVWVHNCGASIVQRVARAEYARGIQYLQTHMTAREAAAFARNPAQGARFLGTAVHRATAQALRNLHGGRFNYHATRAYDFLDRATGQAIELTTQLGRRTHRNRGADIVTYP